MRWKRPGDRNAMETNPKSVGGTPGSVLLGGCAIGAGLAYHAAFAWAGLAWMVLVYLALVFEIRRARSARAAFWLGTLAGLATMAPRLGFLWEVFGFPLGGITVSLAAPVLWLILALFHGLFVLLLRSVESHAGSWVAAATAPVLWMGIEYLRAEGWWLRVPWFTVGEAMDAFPGWVPVAGVYGAGAVAAGIVSVAWMLSMDRRTGERNPWKFVVGISMAAAVSAGWLAAGKMATSSAARPGGRLVTVAGLQLETPAVPDLLAGLGQALARHPDATLLVCGEYSLDGPPPESLRRWCREHRRWLVIGGTESVANAPSAGPGFAPASLRGGESETAAFRNTAFVVGPSGNIEFTQAKSVPIQFFRDGLPAARQSPWQSPWGRIGIAVCYDAGYRRVMDPLVRGGAEALLVIAMDAESWGADEHGLNSRITRLRGVEYGLPLVRVATSGISGIYDSRGVELAGAGFPGQGESFSGTVRLAGSGTVPVDAWLAPAASVASVAIAIGIALAAWRRHPPRAKRDVAAITS